MNNLIERQAAIDVLLKLQRALQLLPDQAILVIQYALREIEQLPSAQPGPEIHWGYTPTYERPLADREIVSRLRDIQKQVGGSYAIDRAIEIIEAVAERRTE